MMCVQSHICAPESFHWRVVFYIISLNTIIPFQVITKSVFYYLL